MAPLDLTDLLAGLELAVFLRERKGHFSSLNPLPTWAAPIVGQPTAPGGFGDLAQNSFFLEHFLEEAEEFWARGVDGTLPSCAWNEPALSSDDEMLQATAVLREGKQLLVMSRAGKVFAEHRALLQHSRQGQLEQEALIKEVEKKEVLVHCIVHDLANPLSGIAAALQMLEREPLMEMSAKLVRMALDSCGRQQTMILQILDVFSAEASTMAADQLDPAQAPDLLALAQGALTHMALTFSRRGVHSRLVVGEGIDATQPLRVVGEETRLERIFANLLENALRHSPVPGEVEIRLSRQGDFVEVCIEDAGGGVPAAAIPNLFRKLAPSISGKRGKAGLGLYFCRITVEKWGGQIGYRAGAQGACFWFRLRLVA